MSTVSVPLTAKLEEVVTNLIGTGFGSNKADVIRKAIVMLAEEEAVQAVLRAEQEVREGKALSGDLRKLVKRIKI